MAAAAPTRSRNLPAVIEVVEGEVVDQAPAAIIEAKIKEALREGKTALWKLAEGIYEFDSEQGWAKLGYQSLTQWLEDPDIDMTRGTYYRLKNTWHKLAIEKNIPRAQLEEVSMSKAALVADEIAQGTVRPTTALKDVQKMSAQQLREKYEKPRRGRPPKQADVRQHSPSTALKAASELPWDWVEQAISGRAPIALREARLQEALKAMLAWRTEFLLPS